MFLFCEQMWHPNCEAFVSDADAHAKLDARSIAGMMLLIYFKAK